MFCVGVGGKGSDSSGIGRNVLVDNVVFKVGSEESGTEMERGF